MSTVDIIATVYNGESYLEEFLQSIKMQTFADWRLILVDDGSTDNSLSICNKYKDLDSRIIVKHTSNMGSFLARRSGVEYITSLYVLFLDSDDFLLPHALYEIVNAFERTGVDAVFYKYEKNGKILPDINISKQMTYQETTQWFRRYIMSTSNSYNQLWSKAWKANVILNDNECYGGLETIKKGTDFVQLLPWLDRIDKVYFMERSLYIYKINDFGITNRNKNLIDLTDSLYKTYKWKCKYLEKWAINRTDSDKLFLNSFLSHIYNMCLLNDEARTLRKNFSLLTESDYYRKGIKYAQKDIGVFDHAVAFFIIRLIDLRCFSLIYFLSKLYRLKKCKY